MAGRLTLIVLGSHDAQRRKMLGRSLAVLGGVLLGLAAQHARADDDCTYNGTKYSEGSASCQAGLQFRCNDGEWKAVGVACSSDKPAMAPNCQFGGVTYPAGTASCQGGTQYRCDNGAWASLDVACPAADSPIKVLPQGRGCLFNDVPVSHNSAICKQGTTYLCSNGDWVILGTKCR
jgi:hypothetical protein